ncbi:TetR family transcriptional regulator [Sodalis-like endosymbiont of Proechinophthirus fluctus]|uniref:TetR family transcriptional regulator n=1 Tax=Sodalis-like endosymbiont of Proechinophthirus fluctus TaxID=1462730 RepID=UPI000B256EBA|nr:TetR family transcriptional regulator [Sodalis-like endosymbiont of Proechinophthirus fluctus]
MISRRCLGCRGAIYWHFKNKAELFKEIIHTADSKVRDFETEYQIKYPDNILYMLNETMNYILYATVSNHQ